LTITQKDYTEKILQKFNLECSHPVITPMATKQVKRRASEKSHTLEQPPKIKVPFRQAIDCLLYLANVSKTDTSYSIGYLARRQVEATYEDWVDVERVLRYLTDSTQRGITFHGREENLEAITDASFCDYAGSISTYGYVIRLYGDVGAEHFRNKKTSQMI